MNCRDIILSEINQIWCDSTYIRYTEQNCRDRKWNVVAGGVGEGEMGVIVNRCRVSVLQER